MIAVRTLRVGRALVVAVVTAAAATVSAVNGPAAAAVSCPDVEVVFARGTSDRTGLGWAGKAFVNSLKWKLLGKKVSAYAVDYPASWNFPRSTWVGAVDANKHVQYIAGMCPDTKIVLGGMSQGAGVIDLITIGNRTIRFFRPVPLPDSMVDHIAAIAVFGNPSRDVSTLGALTRISPLYGDRAIDLCANGDPYCSDGINFFAHLAYRWNGMINEAATFTAGRVLGVDS